ncbi:MAG TPA: hypothetical protein VGE06_08350 [Flavisolibacter sp.]
MRTQFVYTFVSILVWMQLVQPVNAQISGCTDPTATNFNSSATVNNGSCEYNPTFYNPVVKLDPLDSKLNETSALQMAGGSLWTLNDGGGAAAIYRIDTTTNAILQTVTLGGASNGDWEALAFDGTHLYIGAFGNNVNGARVDLRIYKLPLSAIPGYTGNPAVTIPAGQIEVISFTYSDQPQPPVATSTNNTAFDCAAMIVDGGKIHLFSKNWLAPKTTHYVIDGIAAGSYIATPVEELETGYLVTGASKAPGTDLVVLLGYQNGIPANHYLHLLSEYSGGLYFNGNKRKISLPDASYMGQAEGVTFLTKSYGFISSERVSGELNGVPYTITPKLFTFNITEFLPSIVLPLQLKQFEARKQNGANQLQWQFVAPVKELAVQYSSDRINFTTLQTYKEALAGSLLHKPESRSSSYRLAWKGEQGAIQYSAVRHITSSIGQTLSQVVLQPNGELVFTSRRTNNERYRFRLLSADGKLLAEAGSQQLVTGTNRVRFPKTFIRHTTLVLEIVSSGESDALLLSVQ